MHGRVKVRTSEEEKARKEKDRQLKLKLYNEAMQKITSKRKLQEFDKELLDITAQVLCSNPDIYTVWNIRRETLEAMRNSSGDNEGMSKIYDDELSLTEYCLKYNHKSYSAWHQREWVLTTREDPDWKKELMLCEKYLKLDERNFHTWDYRRFLVSHCHSSLKDEFDFTTEKILDNFSNYSAWHYRSKILIELYPDSKGGRPIEDSCHKHELKMVQSAAFTDPDDTSAWFYQRWLLSAVKETTQIVCCKVSPEKTTVAFNKTVPNDLVASSVSLVINNQVVKCIWVSCTGNSSDSLWICNFEQSLSEDLDVKVEFVINENKQIVNCKKQGPSTYIGKSKINFQKQYSEPVIEELLKQLEVCRDLLRLEPDNKWTLLTTTIFLHCIDPKKYHEESIQNLNTLKTIDKNRQGYYDDLISTWIIEDMLMSLYETDDINLKLTCKEKITTLPHMQYLSIFENVDLSNQALASRSLSSLIMLQHCKSLNLENNNLTTLKSFPNANFQVVNLKGNSIMKEEIEIVKQRTKVNFDL